jgi:hypothetical protein
MLVGCPVVGSHLYQLTHLLVGPREQGYAAKPGGQSVANGNEQMMTAPQVSPLVSKNSRERARREGRQGRAGDHHAATPSREAIHRGGRMIDHQYAETLVAMCQ